MDDLTADFVHEATAAVAALQAGLARLARDRADRDAAAEMLSRLHGLKGVCGFAGFARAEVLAHAGETLLARIGKTGASPEALIALTRMTERLALMFVSAAEPAGDEADAVAALAAAAAGLSAPLPIAASPAAAPARTPGDRRRAPWTGLDSLVRALGDRLGKRIELAVAGDDIRIAGWAVAPLRAALIALVRNACDHGVETPAERRAAGKPARALIRLSLHRRGEDGVIELTDDGRGVDPEQLRILVVAAGRLTLEEAAAMAYAELQGLIFEAGVTTAEAVTALSGRGLGLGLVRREIESIGGAVEFASAPGCGASFLLKLPAAAIATSAARGRAAA